MALTVPDQGEGSNDLQSELFQSTIDALSAGHALTGVVSGCAVTAQASPNMTVAVAAGTVSILGVQAAVTGGNVTIGAADATNPRLDLVVSDGSGVKSVIAGTAAAAPKEPTLDTATYVLLAQVYVPATATTITTARITDRRVIVPPAVNVQTFTSSGTWTKPTGATNVAVVCIGGGGGGGSGRIIATGVNTVGGGGGGGGAYSGAVIPAATLSATETVTVGAAGSGGTGVTGTTAGVIGNDGTAGGTTSFGTNQRLRAPGGAAGSGNSGNGGVGGTGQFPGGAGGNGTTGGGASSPANVPFAAGGGGAGGSLDSGIRAGGVGGTNQGGPNLAGGTAGAAGTGAGNGGNGGAGNASPANEPLPGSGGGGGGASNGGTGGSGAAGGRYGGGGGGGGTTTSTGTSGSGGAGAAGICVVVSW